MKSELYLHTLLHLNSSVLVIIHHMMYALQGLQAVAICLAHTRRRHHHAGVYMCEGGSFMNIL